MPIQIKCFKKGKDWYGLEARFLSFSRPTVLHEKNYVC